MNFKLIFLLTFIILNVSCISQTISPQTYKVTSLPQNAGYDVSVLNKEMRSASSENDVLKIIKSHKQLLTVPIIVRIIKSSTEIYWLRINHAQIDKEGDFTVFQSKSNDAGKFYTTGEVRKYFRDTIVCFDTLRIGMYLQDDDFRIEDYFFRNLNNNISTNIAIPYDKNNNLVITSSLFNDQSKVIATLYNKQNVNDSIAHCTLVFLDEATKASLTDIVKDLKKELPGADMKELANYLSSYIIGNYGKASYTDTIHFLNENLK